MATHDYVIANGTGAAVRSDLNGALAAIVSQNSSASAPATMYAYMLWADTTAGIMKMRNGANSAWISLWELDGTFIATDISLSAGTAGAPSLYFTGDTNTGIYSPGADQVAISTGGTGRLFVSSAGLVGINTTGPLKELQINATTPTIRLEENGGGSKRLEISIDSSALARIDATQSGSQLLFGTVGTERVRIDSSGRLLVGTSTDRSASYGSLAQVYATDSTASFTLRRGSANSGSAIFNFFKTRGNAAEIVSNGDALGNIYFQGADGTNIVAAAAISAEVDGTPGTNDMPGRLVLSTTSDGASSPTERMRITQAGAVLFARTSGGLATPGAGFIANTGGAYGEIVQSNNGVACLYLSQNFNSGTQTAVDLRFNNTQVGTINISSSATSYNTSSDYRLKENVVPLTGAIDRVNNLQVRRFNFIVDPAKTVDGFIAHEAQAVVPEAVTGAKDAVDADGNPVYQGIDQSKLVPLLTAALQEAVAEIQFLKDRVTALESA